jgi:elongation factor 1-gamma
MTFTLYANQGNANALKALIAAQYNGIHIDVPDFELLKDNTTAEFKAKNPVGKVPVLETSEGSIFESNAIARYVSRLRPDLGLYGNTLFESAQVDSWVDLCAHEFCVPLSVWLYPLLGWMPFNAEATTKAKADIKKILQLLENHLHLRTYIVGEQVTLADITFVSALFYPMKFLMDAGFRKPYTNVNRWFNTCVNQPEFAAVLGDVPLCSTPLIPKGDTTSKLASKSSGKKEKKKDTASTKEVPAPKPKKQEHPLAVLNKEFPSSMNLDAWKVCYSNTKPLSKAMDWFWENLDKKGYSVWFCDYNYNNENKVMFMTCNAVGGFIQRSDAIRKYAFGVMDVLGSEGKSIEITGCWLFRGNSAEHMIEANPDAEYYTWKKVETFDDATKSKISAYWCNEDTLFDKPIADSKVFK